VIQHIGLSEADGEQLEHAQQLATIVTVQNMHNLVTRDFCTSRV
jgi:aryl-alcohol dehydrogenase-like predicted oxidoreductase